MRLPATRNRASRDFAGTPDGYKAARNYVTVNPGSSICITPTKHSRCARTSDYFHGPRREDSRMKSSLLLQISDCRFIYHCRPW